MLADNKVAVHFPLAASVFIYIYDPNHPTFYLSGDIIFAQVVRIIATKNKNTLRTRRSGIGASESNPDIAISVPRGMLSGLGDGPGTHLNQLHGGERTETR